MEEKNQEERSMFSLVAQFSSAVIVTRTDFVRLVAESIRQHIERAIGPLYKRYRTILQSRIVREVLSVK